MKHKIQRPQFQTNEAKIHDLGVNPGLLINPSYIIDRKMNTGLSNAWVALCGFVDYVLSNFLISNSCIYNHWLLEQHKSHGFNFGCIMIVSWSLRI